jgi:hypothetical protein
MAFSYKAVAQTSASDSVISVQEDFNYNGGNPLADDNLSVIKTDGYFNPIASQINVGDKIYIIDNAGEKDLVVVTAVDPDVTVSSLLGGGAPYSIVFAGQVQSTGGGGQSEQYSVPGVLATDLVFVQMNVIGAGAVTVLSAGSGVDQLLVTYSADPSNDHQINYQVVRPTP